MRKYEIVGVLVLLALACARPVTAQAPKGQGAFAGKVVVVNVKSSGTMGATLKQVRVERFGSHEFLVGTAIEAGKGTDWRAGQTVWIALDDVLEIVEFGSIEDLKQVPRSPEHDS